MDRGQLLELRALVEMGDGDDSLWKHHPQQGKA